MPPSLRTLPPLILRSLFGLLLLRTTSFMSWPFLSLILSQSSGLSPWQVGLLLGSATGLAALLSPYIGWWVDQWGCRPVMCLGCLLSACASLLLAFSHSLTGLGIGIFASMLAFSLIDIPGKALIGNALASAKERNSVLQLRYFLISAGIAAGAVAGSWLNDTSRQEGFLIAASGAVLMAILLHTAPDPPIRQHKSLSCKQALQQAWGDPLLRTWVMVSLLLTLVFAQFESPLAQYLLQLAPERVSQLIALLLTCNAATTVLLQYPLTHLLSKWPPAISWGSGILLFALSQLMFACAPISATWLWVVATIMLSLGETLLFPMLHVLIDQRAPAGLKGSYFGISGMIGLGWAIGPLLGGILLTEWGGGGLFGSMALLSLAAGVLFYQRRAYCTI